jgi:bacterioferritin-associated ferredoxin
MEAKNIVVQNQLVRLCCGKCVKKVQANPDAWVKKVQEQAIAAQKPGYPLDTCVISGEKLGDSAVDTVIGSRLVRTCCGKCAAKVKANPQAAFAKLDAVKK